MSLLPISLLAVSFGGQAGTSLPYTMLDCSRPAVSGAKEIIISTFEYTEKHRTASIQISGDGGKSTVQIENVSLSTEDKDEGVSFSFEGSVQGADHRFVYTFRKAADGTLIGDGANVVRLRVPNDFGGLDLTCSIVLQRRDKQ